MNNNIGLKVMVGIALVILSLPLITGMLGTYKQGSCVTIPVVMNGTTTMNLSIYYPNSSLVVNTLMTKQETRYVYTYCYTALTGEYNYDYCGDTGECYQNNFEITTQGLEKDNNFLGVIILLVCALFMSKFIYERISKLFGSIMIMIIGIGILVTITEYGWIGWIVFAIGFLVFVYSILTPKKKRRF